MSVERRERIPWEPGLVSAVIPCYNAARFLPRAIESVLTQTYRPVEVLLIDDGSTDGTAACADAYQETVRYYRQENRGAAAARNLGISLARGEFIAFLDADDVWYPSKIEAQLRRFREDPRLGMVYSGCHSIDENGTVTGYYLKRRLFRKRDLAENVFIKDFIPNSTIVVRADCLKQVGVIDESIELCEDEDLKIRLADAVRVEGVRRPLAGWRQHSGNKSLLIDKLKETFDHDTSILIRKLPRLARFRREREAILYENCGLLQLRERKNRAARNEFRRAVALNPRRWRCWGFWLLSFPGPGTVNSIIRMKKRLETGWSRVRPGGGETGERK
ncbi:MAG TPA: glycosyltransferase [bacterium]|mgnify:CR=1 FL=1|nr:glycosyltransferase [bacterium]